MESLTAPAVLCLATIACNGPSSRATIRVAEIGHVVVGGATISIHGRPRPLIRAPNLPDVQIDPGGDFAAGGTYVHYVRLEAPRHKLPILLLPGGGLSGAVYEMTPDGRPGWESFFLRKGYSVFTADLQQTGRSPWSRYPEINADEPSFRDRAFLWETFRIGPPGSYAQQRSFASTQFPVAAFDTFAKLAAPRFRSTPEIEAATFDGIIERVCPCVVLAHSASAGPALAAADRRPDVVKAVIAVEPSSVPDVQSERPSPTLVLWGDFLTPDRTQPSWSEELLASRWFVESRSGATFLDLPSMHIKGNSHLLMCDVNSDDVAELVDYWLRKRDL